MQGERRASAPTYNQKRFVNAAYSKHVKFKDDEEAEYIGESPEPSDTEEDGLDEQLRAVYATKSKRPPPKPNKHSPTTPLIPKEQYENLTETGIDNELKNPEDPVWDPWSENISSLG